MDAKEQARGFEASKKSQWGAFYVPEKANNIAVFSPCYPVKHRSIASGNNTRHLRQQFCIAKSGKTPIRKRQVLQQFRN